MNRDVGIFSFGYWGWGNRVKKLKRESLKHNWQSRGRGLVWVDIRLHRNVRAKGFNGDTPRRLLGAENYAWIRDLGNVKIKGNEDAVKIRDYENGLVALRAVVEGAAAKKSDLILFCACEFRSYCHRKHVMNWLKNKRIPGAKVYGEFDYDDAES